MAPKRSCRPLIINFYRNIHSGKLLQNRKGPLDEAATYPFSIFTGIAIPEKCSEIEKSSKTKLQLSVLEELTQLSGLFAAFFGQPRYVPSFWKATFVA